MNKWLQWRKKRFRANKERLGWTKTKVRNYLHKTIRAYLITSISLLTKFAAIWFCLIFNQFHKNSGQCTLNGIGSAYYSTIPQTNIILMLAVWRLHWFHSCLLYFQSKYLYLIVLPQHPRDQKSKFQKRIREILPNFKQV